MSTTGAVDTVRPPTHGDTELQGVRGTDRPPGRRDLGMALIFILPALVGFVVSTLSRFLLQPDEVQHSRHADLHRHRQLHPAVPGQAVWSALLVTVEYVFFNIVLRGDHGQRRPAECRLPRAVESNNCEVLRDP